jgi:hypothetical protein
VPGGLVFAGAWAVVLTEVGRGQFPSPVPGPWLLPLLAAAWLVWAVGAFLFVRLVLRCVADLAEPPLTIVGQTSCSAMFTYVVSRAVERGYVDASLKAVASRGYQGVLARISLDSHGLTNLTQICIGTNVGARLSADLTRPRATNDFHGLGAFLILNEQLMRTGG